MSEIGFRLRTPSGTELNLVNPGDYSGTPEAIFVGPVSGGAGPVFAFLDDTSITSIEGLGGYIAVSGLPQNAPAHGFFRPASSYIPFGFNRALADDISLALSVPNTNLAGTPANGFPKVNSPGPANRGAQYFSSVSGSATGVQDIDVSAVAELIDTGGVIFGLSGFLGGHGGQDDRANVSVTFKDGSGATLSTSALETVTAADRGGTTGLLHRNLDGGVPSGTRNIRVQVDLIHVDGAFNDASVDSLSLIFKSITGAELSDVGLADTHFAVVNWGDLSPLETALARQQRGEADFIRQHTYGDNGVLNVTVAAQDDDHNKFGPGQFNNGLVFDGFQVTVLNVPPTVTGQANIFVKDEAPTSNLVLASFTDPGSNDRNFTATVDWGGGTVETDAGSVNVTVDQGRLLVTGRHTYSSSNPLTDGPYPQDVTASITVTDKDGGSTTVFITNTIFDLQIPFVNAGDDLTITEGGAISVNGSSQTIDPPPLPVTLRYEYVWDFGDGSPVVVQQIAPSTGIPEQTPLNNLTAPSHSYGDDGQAVVNLTIRGISVASGQVQAAKNDSFVVTINNAPPIIATMNVSPAPPEGSSTVLSATYSDLGSGDTHSVQINWDDNSPVVPGLVNQAANSVSASHVYADNGPYTVTMQVCDDDGDCDSATGATNVSNVTPSVNAGSIQTVTEGSVVSLSGARFIDVPADTHTATINWGDGTIDSGAVNQVADTVTGSHVYGDNGLRNVQVCVTDDDNATNCGTTQITVLNANPMVSAGQDKNAQEGEVVPIAATFTDSGVDDTHTATIFWGDGTSSPGAVDQDTDSVTGSHVYANDGNFPVRVVVVDDDFGPGEGALVARVSNVATEIVALDLVSAQPIHVEGLPVALTANINDKGTRDSHTATIDWGDGTAIDAGSISENTFGPPGSTAGADGTVTGSHHYADNGSYDVTLCVSDDDVVTCRTQRIEVANAAPVVEAGGNFTVNEGAFTSLAPASFTDSAFDSAAIPSEENFTATIDWGDGTTEPDADITLVETPGSVGTLTHGTVQGSHAYGLYGTYSITVCVADDDHDPDSASPIDGQSCDTLIVTVNNVAPILDAGSDRSVFEGARFTMNPATFSDEGYNNEFTATIDWGDGTTEPEAEIVVVAVPGTKGTLLTGSVQAFHHYGDNGTYTIDVCLNDGRAVVCDTSSVTVINVEPSVDAGEDQITDEGTFITLDPATYSDPGFDNTSAPTQENFSATIDWGDGNFEPEPVTGPLDGITLTEHAGAEGALTTGTVQAAHAYGDNGVYTVTVCVTDDDNATTCDTLQVTVSNVPPSVVAGPDRVISESDAIFIGPPPGTGDQAPATYSDPGFDNLAADVPTLATQENFTSTIDWGEGTVDVGALTEAPGAEGALTTGKVSGSHVYGDDGTYTVTVCVTDDDLAQTCNTFTVTVLNVDPTLKDSVFLDPKITFTSGDDAFLGRKGIQQTHSAQATDIGSDDLRYDWTFSYNPDRFDGSLPPTNPTESTTTYNDGSDPSAQPFPDIAPFTDPAREEGAGLHPHGTFPFTSTDTTDVTFTGPGVYTVDLQVTDDNGGTDFATLPKLLTDDCDCVKGKGFWKKEFKERSEKDAKKVEKGQLIDGPTLVAYLDVIRFASSHFNERVPLNSFADAGNVLNTNTNRGSNNGSSNSKAPKDATKESATGSKKKKKAGSSSEGDSADGDSQANNLAKKREDALQQTLAAWLNFAKGGILWDEDVVVDTGTGSGTKARPSVVLPFNDIIAQVEAILNNPDATHDDLVHAKNLAESVNKHDDGNKDCGTGSGSVDGTASVSNKNGGDTKGSDSGSKAKGMKKGK